MLSFWQRREKLASRKFIDLIWRSSNKWAVWDPPQNPVRPGDYGVIDKATGKFERRGNIYTDPALADCLNVGEPASPAVDNAEEVISIASAHARTTAADAGFTVDAQVAKVAFQGGWSFGNQSGAVLVAHKPRQVYLSHNINLELLAEKLNGLCIVTSVTVCPAYALCLAAKGDSEISFALCLETPLPLASVVAGPNVKTKWHNRYGTGLYREGNKEEDVYTVLYDLRVCRKKGWLRDSPEPEGDGVKRRLQEARPPWTTLDDEGEEEACTGTQGFTIPVDDPDEWD